MNTNLPLVFSSSSLPSLTKLEGETYPCTASRSSLRTITFLWVEGMVGTGAYPNLLYSRYSRILLFFSSWSSAGVVLEHPSSQEINVYDMVISLFRSFVPLLPAV